MRSKAKGAWRYVTFRIRMLRWRWHALVWRLLRPWRIDYDDVQWQIARVEQNSEEAYALAAELEYRLGDLEDEEWDRRYQGEALS
jgi:hypothetical protein